MGGSGVFSGEYSIQSSWPPYYFEVMAVYLAYLLEADCLDWRVWCWVIFVSCGCHCDLG